MEYPESLGALCYDLEEFTGLAKRSRIVRVYKSGEKQHKQLIPSEVEKVEFHEDPDTGTVTFELAVHGVPLDADTFTLRVAGQDILTDTLYGTDRVRFYKLTVKVSSEKGEFFPAGPGVNR